MLALGGSAGSANDRTPASITVAFGAGLNTAQPGNTPNHHIIPQEFTVRITKASKLDGTKVFVPATVNFIVSGFHWIWVYNPGVRLKDVQDHTPATGTFVNYDVNVFAKGVNPGTPPAFTDASFQAGQLTFSAQALLVVAASAILIGALYLFFGRMLYGKALRATAVNRIGARLVGISPSFAGALTFALASLLCAFCGVLIGPITTVYYDSGFLISLKGFVGAIIGGLVSYPLAAAGAVLVGLLEAFSSFWASAFKEVIVFTVIIPVLLWRSLTTHHHEEDE